MFQLIVMARDQGMVPYMDFGTVEVKILDMNDNKPLFTTVSNVRELILIFFGLKVIVNFHC